MLSAKLSFTLGFLSAGFRSSRNSLKLTITVIALFFGRACRYDTPGVLDQLPLNGVICGRINEAICCEMTVLSSEVGAETAKKDQRRLIRVT